jgi:hypothetical protein
MVEAEAAVTHRSRGSGSLVWLAPSARSASYLAFTYCFNRLRYYAPAPSAFLELLGRTFRFGRYAFRVPVGEMEACARRES